MFCRQGSATDDAAHEEERVAPSDTSVPDASKGSTELAAEEDNVGDDVLDGLPTGENGLQALADDGTQAVDRAGLDASPRVSENNPARVFSAEEPFVQQTVAHKEALMDAQDDPWQVLEDQQAMAWAAGSAETKPSSDVGEDPWQVLEDQKAMAWAAGTAEADSSLDVGEDPWQVLEDQKAMAWAAGTAKTDSSPDVGEDPWQVLEDQQAMAWAAGSAETKPSSDVGEDPWQVLEDQKAMAWAAGTAEAYSSPDAGEDPWQVLEDQKAMAWAAGTAETDSSPDAGGDPWQVLEDQKAMAWAAGTAETDSSPDAGEDPWQVLEDQKAMAWAAGTAEADSSPDAGEDPWQVLEDQKAMAWAAGTAEADSSPDAGEDPWQVLEGRVAATWEDASAWTQQDDVRTNEWSDTESASSFGSEEDAWLDGDDPWRLQDEREQKQRAELMLLASSKKPEVTELPKQPLPDELPIEALRKEILQAVRSERVTILVGATGCGKSTRLPQFLMNEPRARVLVTQPRRVAAVEIARRVASERGEEIGQNVGYRISGETILGSGKLQFATIGGQPKKLPKA